MKRIRILSLMLFLASLTPVPFALAKGSPDKITIWGPSQVEPIQITNPETLNAFDPWNGQFLDKSLDALAEEPRIQEIYMVVFDLGSNTQEKRAFYVFQYAPDPSGGQGFIYVPREGEPWHIRNGQTIVRKSGWQYASPEWDALVQQSLEENKASPNVGRTSGDIQLAMPIIILVGGVATIWYLRHRQRVST